MKNKLYIKNMVCDRCISAVKNIFNELDIHTEYIELGEVEIDSTLSTETMQAIEAKLNLHGFELAKNNEAKTIEQVKALAIKMVNDENFNHSIKFSDWVAGKLNKSYSNISHVFSAKEGITLEQYLIRLKIEKAKELLSYNNNTLSEIAFQLGYSSVAHLSAQFKKTTGLTPSHFKKIGKNRRVGFDKL